MNLGKYNFLRWHEREDLSLLLLAKTLLLAFLVVTLITWGLFALGFLGLLP